MNGSQLRQPIPYFCALFRFFTRGRSPSVLNFYLFSLVNEARLRRVGGKRSHRAFFRCPGTCYERTSSRFKVNHLMGLHPPFRTSPTGTDVTRLMEPSQQRPECIALALFVSSLAAAKPAPREKSPESQRIHYAGLVQSLVRKGRKARTRNDDALLARPHQQRRVVASVAIEPIVSDGAAPGKREGYFVCLPRLHVLSFEVSSFYSN